MQQSNSTAFFVNNTHVFYNCLNMSLIIALYNIDDLSHLRQQWNVS